MNKRLLIVPCLALLALIGLLSASGAQAQAQTPATKTAPGSPDCPPAWRVVPGASAFLNGPGYDVISAVAPDDVWVLSNPRQVSHWNGSSWTLLDTNIGPFDGLFGIAARSHNDVWVAGYYVPGGSELEPLVVHYDGSVWTVVPSAPTGHQPILQSISIVSPNDVWFAGYFLNFNYPRPLIMHYDGTSVTLSSSPDLPAAFVFTSDILALSRNDVWAAGSYVDLNFASHALTMHWNGTAWSFVPTPDIAGNETGLTSLSAPLRQDDSEGGHKDVWAVGITCPVDCFSGVPQPLAMHYDGRAWSIVSTPDLDPNGGGLNGVAAISRNDVWAVGSYGDGNGGSLALTEHWNGHAWSIVSSPSPNPGSDALGGVSATSRDDGDREESHKEVWAAGTFVERYSTSCR